MKIKPDKRISKLVRTHNRLTMQISGTIPLMVKKTSCAMVLLPSFGIRRWSFYDNHGLFSKPIYILNFPYFVSI